MLAQVASAFQVCGQHPCDPSALSQRRLDPLLGDTSFAAQREYLRQRCNGATVPHLDARVLEAMEIPIPRLEEQHRIAEVLDRADGATRQCAPRQFCSACCRIRFSLHRVLWRPWHEPKGLARQPTPGGREEEGTIVTYGIVQAGDEHPGGIPYIRTGDIVNGEIVLDRLRRTDPKIAARFSRSRLEGGDIVMSIRATVGTTALVPPELAGANLTQGTARIAPGESVEPSYLLGLLRAQGTQHWISRQIKGATFREITLARLRELPVALPPIALQREYARGVAAIEKLRTTHAASLTEMDALLGALRRRAFQGTLLRRSREP